jgi:hypothetical protein
LAFAGKSAKAFDISDISLIYALKIDMWAIVEGAIS